MNNYNSFRALQDQQQNFSGQQNYSNPFGNSQEFGTGPNSMGYPSYNQPYTGSQNMPVPYQPQQFQQPAQQLTEQKSTNPLANLPIKDIKAIVDRVGGIDGIMNTVTKMQKLVNSFQSMGPMLKLLMGSFGGKAATASGRATSNRRRRRRRRRPSSTKRRTTASRRSGRRQPRRRS